MLCDKCGKNPATTYYKEIINGNVREVHLCEDCARELGFGAFAGLGGFGDFGLGNLLGSLFPQQDVPTAPLTRSKRCSVCGTSFEEFTQSAQAGCANCYREFYRELLPWVERIHGKTRHIGKVPKSASQEVKKRRTLEELRRQLNDAVSAQEYEKAAKLRDQIRGMEDHPE